MKPRSDLTPGGRRDFIAILDRALRTIPEVRQVRIGRRLTHGATYEGMSPDAADYLAIIEFDDLASLQAYLRHPAHDELGAKFYEVLSSAFVYDFEIVGLEGLDSLEGQNS